MTARRFHPKPALRCLAAGLIAAMLASSPVAAQTSEIPPAKTGVGTEAVSADVRAFADWAQSGDARGLPFAVIDKRAARVFVFDPRGGLLGATPALFGLSRGDVSAPGIGQRRLAEIAPHERTTPAGRFQASLGHDFEQDILWIDYESALSLHRVIAGNPKDRRRQRLASPSPDDNRISYGCINVPAAFYDKVVIPAFTGTVGIVYILPESQPLEAVFPALRAPR